MKTMPYNYEKLVPLSEYEFKPKKGTMIYYNCSLNRKNENVEYIGNVERIEDNICYFRKKNGDTSCFILSFKNEKELNNMHRFLRE